MTDDAPPRAGPGSPGFSRESGLLLDREGRWLHRGVPVTHRRLADALTRWIDRDPASGRFIVRLKPNFWAFVDVEDAPFQVLRSEPTAEGLVLHLSDGSTEVLAARELEIGDEDAWYARVKEGRFTARFSRAAVGRLIDLVGVAEDDDAGDDAHYLELPSGRRIALRVREDPAT